MVNVVDTTSMSVKSRISVQDTLNNLMERLNEIKIQIKVDEAELNTCTLAERTARGRLEDSNRSRAALENAFKALGGKVDERP